MIENMNRRFKLIVGIFFIYVVTTTIMILLFLLQYELNHIEKSYGDYVSLYLFPFYALVFNLILFLIFRILDKFRREADFIKIVKLLLIFLCASGILYLISFNKIFSQIMWWSFWLSMNIWCLHKFIQPLYRKENLNG